MPLPPTRHIFSAGDDARAWRVAWALWGIATAVITAMVLWNPTYRSIYYIHPEAARNWLAGQPLYTPAIDYFQYLPQAAILQIPFALLGSPIGDALWRLIGIALLVSGLQRLAQVLAPASSQPAFAVIAVLALLPSLASMQNGQPNLQVAALMLHAALDLGAGRNGRSAATLVLAVAVKPVALVLLLLVGALYPPLRWRLALGIALAAVLPFLTQAPGYVVDQYAGAFAKMLRSAQPDRNTFTDLNGVYWTLTGASLNRALLLTIQLAAAAATLLLGWVAVRRRSPADAALTVWALACIYLMLFNPRNESNAFVIIAPAVAAIAAARFVDPARSRLGGAVIASMAVVFGGTGITQSIHNWSSPWLKPVVAAVFAAIVIRALLRDDVLFTARVPAEGVKAPAAA